MPTRTQSNPLKQIEIDAIRSEISEVAAYLQGHLGQRVTAYLSGLKDPKIVGQWADGKIRPRDRASLRLRDAYQAARLIVESFGDESAKAWFFGTNSQLDDKAPAYVLRHGDSPEQVGPVVRAARSFAEDGRRFASGRKTQAARESSNAEVRELAHLLMKEIQRHNEHPKPGSRSISDRLKKELLKPQPLTERIRVLDRAQQEISEQLDEFVERLKNDLRTSKSVAR